MTLKRTPLFHEHLRLDARMGEFAGYEMPISYDSFSGGMSKEHVIVREGVGIFDVCHMGEFWISGKRSTEFLNWACSRNFSATPSGKAQYCLISNESGGIIDDIIVYKVSDEKYWMVVNASNIRGDFEHLTKIARNFDVEVRDVSDETGLIAIQGPRAADVLDSLMSEVKSLKYYHFKSVPQNGLVARTGYTGEDGFEVFLPISQISELWKNLLERGAKPIGLGARDILRLEVGFPLYGHELSLELKGPETLANFAFDRERTFYGSEKARMNLRFQPMALIADSPKPMRAGERILWKGEDVGYLTSGSTSPILKKGIGLGLVKRSLELQKGSVFMLESGGKQREARSIELPFVTTSRVKTKRKD